MGVDEGNLPPVMGTERYIITMHVAVNSRLCELRIDYLIEDG